MNQLWSIEGYEPVSSGILPFCYNASCHRGGHSHATKVDPFTLWLMSLATIAIDLIRGHIYLDVLFALISLDSNC